MVTTSTKRIKTMAFGVNVNATDIADGECELANRCMVRVAVERKLRNLEPEMPWHHTRVDAGHIRFNYNGHRWVADTPRVAKAALIKFDREAKARRQAKKRGVEFESEVGPFSFKVYAEMRSRLVAKTRERKDQINVARRKRIAAGQTVKQYTLHKRVVGFA